MNIAPAVLTPTLNPSLLEIWADRYQFDTSTPCTTADLIGAISEVGRRQTVTKARKRLRVSSELAALKTSDLFSYVANVVNLSEVQKIAEIIQQVYDRLLVIYQQQPISADSLANVGTTNSFGGLTKHANHKNSVQLLAVEEIAREIEPLMERLKKQHLDCRDRRAIGFMSTQFHFSTAMVLKGLQPVEQMLIKPYLQFVEEQVCIPWQRVCAAADRQPAGSSEVSMVKAMLPQANEIAKTAFDGAVLKFPTHQSRRGLLTQTSVAASSLRDMNMFQTYLWLSLLEGNLSSVENELLPLCVMVFPSISVDWEVVQFGVGSIVSSVRTGINNQSQPTLLAEPYLEGMQALFENAKNVPQYADLIS